MGKDDEPKIHLYHVQMIDDLAIEDGRWAQIKAKIKFDESLNEEQRKQLWELLEEYQGVFAWHKGKLG
jgi:hypothetical protein